MRLARQLPLCLAVLGLLAACPGLAEESGIPSLPEKKPAFRGISERPREAEDAEKNLPSDQLASPLSPPPSLLPEGIPPSKTRPAGGRPSAGGKPIAIIKPPNPAADLDLRIRYRKARNIAETNDAVRSAWDATRYRKNDDHKRRALKRYYDVLFTKMLSVDRGIAPLIEKRRTIEIAALTQKLIAPTVPNE
jgi:hypothetical protein